MNNLRGKSAARVIEAYEKGYRVAKDGTALGPTGVEIGCTRFRKREGNYKTLTVRFEAPRRVFVHQLQAYQKFGIRALEIGVVVRHKNGNSLDNSEDNILIGTLQDNSLDRPPDERQKQAQLAANAKKRWTDDEVRSLRTRYFVQGARVKDLATEQGVSKGQMSMMLRGLTYKTIPLDHGESSNEPANHT